MTNEQAIQVLLDYEVIGCGYCSQNKEYEIAIDKAVDALKDRKQGEWLYYNGDTLRCTNCNYHSGQPHMAYCPNCGAQMYAKVKELNIKKLLEANK